MANQTATLVPDSQDSDLMARIAYLEAEVRQRDEDHMAHVMELSGRIRELVQNLDASEADASQTRAQLKERERQLEKRSSFEAESLNLSGGSSSEDLCTRLVAVEARSAEQDLERRACEEEHAAREAELTGHIRDLAKRADYAEAELGKLRQQLESERAQHINLQVEREGLVKSLREQVDALSRENFHLSSDLDRCMEELRKNTSERLLFWDRRLVTQGLAVYFQQRDPATQADVLARLADTLEFTPEERQRLGVVRRLSRREQELANTAHARDKRRALTDLADEFLRFISTEAEEPLFLQGDAEEHKQTNSKPPNTQPINSRPAAVRQPTASAPTPPTATEIALATTLCSDREAESELGQASIITASDSRGGFGIDRKPPSPMCISAVESLQQKSDFAAAHPFVPEAGEL